MKKSGGKRPGAGAPKKEETTLINFRMVKSRKQLLKKLYPNISKEFKDWTDTLIENKL